MKYSLWKIYQSLFTKTFYSTYVKNYLTSHFYLMELNCLYFELWRKSLKCLYITLKWFYVEKAAMPINYTTSCKENVGWCRSTAENLLQFFAQGQSLEKPTCSFLIHTRQLLKQELAANFCLWRKKTSSEFWTTFDLSCFCFDQNAKLVFIEINCLGK